MVIVEYIQPVCPYCNLGLYVTTTRGDAANDYYCQAHGNIEARLVRYALCKQENGTVLLPASYET